MKKKTTEKINKAQIWCFKNINKMDKLWARVY